MTHFIFSKGVWLGEGVIAFAGSPDTVKFFTRWTIEKEKDGMIACMQEVELHGLEQKSENAIHFTLLKEGDFKISLENELMGKVTGKGIWDKKKMAWELRDQPGMEGYEVYELQENGEYIFHSEFSSPPFRTIIDGRLWKTDASS